MASPNHQRDALEILKVLKKVLPYEICCDKRKGASPPLVGGADPKRRLLHSGKFGLKPGA